MKKGNSLCRRWQHDWKFTTQYALALLQMARAAQAEGLFCGSRRDAQKSIDIPEENSYSYLLRNTKV